MQLPKQNTYLSRQIKETLTLPSSISLAVLIMMIILVYKYTKLHPSNSISIPVCEDIIFAKSGVVDADAYFYKKRDKS